MKTPSLKARKANLQDAKAIHQLIDSLTLDGTLLRRPYSEICKNIHTFTVVESETSQFIGCAALHVYGPHLAEIRSIVVRPESGHHGAGSLLVEALLQQAKETGIKGVCLFTRIPLFFERFNFSVAQHERFQDKVRKDCQNCARRNACDETPMIFGELPPLESIPTFQPIYPQQGELVQLQL